MDPISHTGMTRHWLVIVVMREWKYRVVPLRCSVSTCPSEKLVTGRKGNVNIEAAELEESAMPLDSLSIFNLLWW